MNPTTPPNEVAREQTEERENKNEEEATATTNVTEPERTVTLTLSDLQKLIAGIVQPSMVQNASAIRRLGDITNKVPFTEIFDGNAENTLTYIAQMERHIRLNNVTDPDVQFQVIMMSLPQSLKDGFYEWVHEERELIEEHNGQRRVEHLEDEVIDDNHNVLSWQDELKEDIDDGRTLAYIKQWLVDMYPPPMTTFNFIENLRTIKFRNNECPKRVYQRFDHKLRLMREAIAIMKSVNAKQKRRVPELRETDLEDILSKLWIHENNSKEHGNCGAINKKVYKWFLKKDPEDWPGWQAALKEMRTHQFVSHHEARRSEFQLKIYPAHEYDDQIYHDSKKRKTQIKGLHVDQLKSYPGKHCVKCGRNNHSTAECRANHRCSICDRIGHDAKSCWRNDDNKGSYRGNNAEDSTMTTGATTTENDNKATKVEMMANVSVVVVIIIKKQNVLRRNTSTDILWTHQLPLKNPTMEIVLIKVGTEQDGDSDIIPRHSQKRRMWMKQQ